MPTRWSYRTWAVIAALIVAALAVFGAVTARAHRAENRLMRADPETILANPDLRRTALSVGQKAYAGHCASCHGNGRGDPARGIPDLTDGDWLYGSGEVADVEQIVLYGIRSGNPRGWQLASMPAYARAKPYGAEPIPPLAPREIADATQFLLDLHGRSHDAAAAARGKALYRGKAGCYDCHSPDGAGDPSIGAPNLLDDVWLYGDGSAASIAATLRGGRAGFSPAYARVLKPVEARAVAAYVASLSHRGGKTSE